MKTKISTTFLMLALFINIHAQDKRQGFGLELNSGISLAIKEIDNNRLNPGIGFEGILHYDFMPRMGVYVGWGWNKFANSGTGTDVCYEETGYVLGLNYRIRTSNPRISYYLRAGGLYNHVETEDSNGEIISDTKHGFGFQVAGGIAIVLGEKWSFTPGIRFNSLSRDVKYEEVSKQTEYQYISARIGFARSF